MQQGRLSDDGRKRGDAWGGPQNQSEKVSSKRKSEKEKVQGEILDHQEEQDLPKELHEGWVKKLLRAGTVPAKPWGAHAAGIARTERLKLRRQMAAAACKKSTTPLSLFVEAYGLEVQEELSTLATQ